MRVGVGQPLPTTLAFEYPTIQALTRYLAEDVLALEMGKTAVTESKANAETNAERHHGRNRDPVGERVGRFFAQRAGRCWILGMLFMRKFNRFPPIVWLSLLFIGTLFVACRSSASSSQSDNTSNQQDDTNVIMPSPEATSGQTDATSGQSDTTSGQTDTTSEATSAQPSASSVPLVGIGIIGGSNSDEYRGDDNRGGEYAATTLGWVEQLVKSRQLNFGEWGEWGEPRRTGFAYNWARSGATAHDMIETGQHTGLAQQIADGQVSHALLFIGSNDFSALDGSYQAIYDGTLDDAGVQAKVNEMTADITTAVDTLLAAGDVKLGIVSVADPAILPEFQAVFADGRKRQRVTAAIDEVNTSIIKLAAEHGLVVIDIDTIFASLVSGMDKKGKLDVGGEKIVVFSRGNEPHSGQLNDNTGHLGTVLSGHLANVLFIDPFNKAYDLAIQPLTDEEILHNAGIR